MGTRDDVVDEGRRKRNCGLRWSFEGGHAGTSLCLPFRHERTLTGKTGEFGAGTGGKVPRSARKQWLIGPHPLRNRPQQRQCGLTPRFPSANHDLTLCPICQLDDVIRNRLPSASSAGARFLTRVLSCHRDFDRGRLSLVEY